jgi:alpha-N-arabinofuranosidase
LTVPEGADRFTTNDQHHHDRVGMQPLADVAVDGGTLRATLPALSWAVVEVEVAKA